MAEGETAAQVGNDAPPPGRAAAAKKYLLVAAVVLAVLALAWLLQWYLHGRFFEKTDDAYLRADMITIAPNVTGLVETVYVKENQDVAEGAPLVMVDQRTYEASLEQAAAGIAARKADVARADAAFEQQHAAIREARAQLSVARLAENFAQRQVGRYEPLAVSGADTSERLEQLKAERDQARAKTVAQAAALESAEKQIPSLQSAIDLSKAQLRSGEATALQARLDLEHTIVRASRAGRVGDLSVRVGQYVQPGTRMMSVVPTDALYITANFKENQIGRMRIGQPVHVEVDALPDADIHGKVASFAPGTGAQFALLPPENATGNFTKIVQRIPVRSSVVASEAVQKLLIPGLSVTVTVDTRGADQAQ